MTDEVQPTVADDTGADEATLAEDTATQTADTPDWQEKYTNLQPEYTRTTQRLSEIEQNLRDPERLPEFLRQYGVELEEPEAQEPEYQEYEDPYETLQARIDRLETERAQEKEEEKRLDALARENVSVSEEIDRIAQANEEQFTEKEVQILGTLAKSMRNDKGKPNVEAAYGELFGEVVKGRRQGWAKTKKAARPGSGAAAVETIDKSTPKGRKDYINRRIQELQDS